MYININKQLLAAFILISLTWSQNDGLVITKYSNNGFQKNMTKKEQLEKRIEILEKEVQHLKAVLQYQSRVKRK